MAIANLFVPYLKPNEFAALVAKIMGEPGMDAWWAERFLGCDNAVVVLASIDGTENVSWAQALTKESGGFCVTRRDFNAVPVVFNSGYLLEAALGDTWEHCFEELCGVTWQEDMANLNGLARFGIKMPTPSANPTWTRVAFSFTSDAAFARAAVEATMEGLSIRTSGWRSLERMTPLAGLPFIIMEKCGECDVALVDFLSKRLDAYAAAVELRSGCKAALWWFDPANGIQAWEGHGSVDVVDAWYRLAIIMGEAAGVIRWPRKQSGHALDRNGALSTDSAGDGENFGGQNR
jgi:hypothetical protein